MAARLLLLLLAVVAASLLAADARPCHTFLVAFPADPNPNPSRGDGAIHHHLGVPHVATVITVFRFRRFGPQVPHGHRNHHHHHLHSIPANVQIHRPDLPRPAAAAAAGPQERARGILVVVVGLLFGVACGALTAASVYLVWSMVAGAAAAAASPYDELYDDKDEASDTESPKKVGYVIIQELQVHDGGKN